MPGYFTYPFKDDEATGYFGGYRRPTRSLSDPVENANMVAGSDPTATPPSIVPDVLTDPSGTKVVDSKGHPYLRPSGFDMQKNLAIAQTIREASENSDTNIGQANPGLLFARHFLPGADMDYQRPNGFFGAKEMQYRPIGYYNYGVMAAKAGYSVERALQNAGLYNRIFGGHGFGANGINTLLGQPPNFDNPYGLNSKDAADYIRQGYEDYTNGRWTSDSSK